MAHPGRGRLVAIWGELLPNESASWEMSTRNDETVADVTIATEEGIRGRVECLGVAGERWTVPVTFEFMRPWRCLAGAVGVDQP
jgi:hypothetical protein